MGSRDIRKCVPSLQEKYWELKRQMALINIPIALSCTSREWDEQRALHAQGRESLSIVNHLRYNVGLAPITEAQNKRPVTWTLDSRHVINDKRKLSEAFDIYISKDHAAIFDLKADVNDDQIDDYKQIAEAGRALGLRPGADWGDYPHFELP